MMGMSIYIPQGVSDLKRKACVAARMLGGPKAISSSWDTRIEGGRSPGRNMGRTYLRWGFALSIVALAPWTWAVTGEPGLLFQTSFEGTLEAFSLAGSGQPVRVTGAVSPAFAPGRFGQALLCGPEQALIHYSTAGNLMPPAGTISLWVQPVNWTSDDPNFHTFFEAGAEGGGLGWLILYKYYQGGWMLLRYADEKGQVGMARAEKFQWRPGEWHHLAGTWSPEALRLYLDGQLVAQAPDPRVAFTLGDTFALGDNGWHLPHSGAQTLLDEVKIFSYPLTPAQIRGLAFAGELAVRRAPLEGQWQAEVAVPKPAGATRVVVQIHPADGPAVLRRAEAALFESERPGRPGVTSVALPVADLPLGPYRVVAQAYRETREVVAKMEVPMRRLEQEGFILQNERIRLILDGATGALLSLESAALNLSGREPAAPIPLFSVETVSFADHARFYQPSDLREEVPDQNSFQQGSVERVENGQRLAAQFLFPSGLRAILTAELPDHEAVVSLRLRVENPRPLRPSEAVRVPRVTFPHLSGLRIGTNAEDNYLATGRIHGEWQRHPAATLPPERVLQYPGSACVPWQDLHNATGGLYLGPLTDGACQLEILSGARDGWVELGDRWWALLEPGETWESPVVELGLHPGAWHWAADRFREWALQHTPPRTQPDWLAECDGWIGMGGPGYRFKDLPKMLEAAKYYGFSYLQMWSQMILGEAYYCYFYPNPDLGTEAELKEAIAQVHAQGGRIGFYSNAICFDGAIDQNLLLQETIEKYQLQDLPPLPRFYDEVIEHVFVGPDGRYGRGGPAGHSRAGYPDGYWAMDPGSPWWQNYLATWIQRWHEEYGADVWYLDSFPVHGYGLGPASYALHQKHPQSLGAGQIALLRRIRERFDGPMLYEGVACAAFMPYTNWCLGTELSFGSGTWSRPEIFVYSFGDVYPVFSGTCNTWTGIGNIWPDLEEPRHEDAMNLVFLLGERCDALGLYPLNPESAYGEHVRKLVALRARIRDVVYQGRFMDERGLSGMPEQVSARVFTRTDPPGVVVTVVDRRKERTPWELRISPQALPWPPGLIQARLLSLGGSAQEVPVTFQEGELSVPIEPSAEAYAVRLD